MSLAPLAAASVVFLVALGAAVSLWRGAARQPWPDLRAYRWFTIAAGLICANVIVGQAVPPAPGTASMLSFTDLPALLLLPVMAAGLAGLASAARRTVPEAPGPRRPRRGLAAASAYLADGYVLAAALFLIGWVSLFGAAFTRSDTGLAFAAVLVHPLVDLMILWVTLPLAQAAGRRAVAPYLALVAVTVGDSLAVGARIDGTRPGTAALAAQLIALVLLGLAPWATGMWAAGGRWLGGARRRGGRPADRRPGDHNRAAERAGGGPGSWHHGGRPRGARGQPRLAGGFLVAGVAGVGPAVPPARRADQ
jgi:hypothetical protein